MLYHGVLHSCNGYVYAFGAALLDLEEPWKVIGRSGQYLITPQELYECVGDVPNVCFPCASLCDAETGRMSWYIMVVLIRSLVWLSVMYPKSSTLSARPIS